MKLFECDHCGQTVYFENGTCVSCGHRLGFDPGTTSLIALEVEGNGACHKTTNPTQRFYFCANAELQGCNWLVSANSGDSFCPACRYNRLVPDISTDRGQERFRRIGVAERHFFYSLLRWTIAPPGLSEMPDGGLVFDFLEDEVDGNGNVTPAMTGHQEGVISLRAAEADDVTREIARTEMNEPYRTLLGHFRHEVGHYIWNLMVRDAGRLDTCRAVFGDDREDYGEALEQHYRNGPVDGWEKNFVSAYASTHPWEDFAETFAHTLHIVDTLETARAFGLSVDGNEDSPLGDPYACSSAKRLAKAWVPLTLAMNSIHRSMGQRDFYPFVLTPPIVGKIDFMLTLLTSGHPHNVEGVSV